MIKKQKILIFGPLISSIGGVSIHIDRFVRKYMNNYEFTVCDLRQMRFRTNNKRISLWLLLRNALEAKIIHIHIDKSIKLILCIIFKFIRKKVMYTHHNSRVNNRFIINKMITLCDTVIFVNLDEIIGKIRFKKKIYEIPAFILPQERNTLPDKIDSKIKTADKIITSNCFRYELFDGKDIYGFDIIIKAFELLNKLVVKRNIILVLVDPSGTANNYVRSLKKNTSLPERIMYIDQKIDYIELIKKSDIVVRATRSDGDSLTVREALYYNKIVIASDCAKRPPGTVTFKSEDERDLSTKLRSAINGKTKVKQQKVNDYGDSIIKIYEELGARK